MQLKMKDTLEYFHAWAREDLCSQCHCQYFQRKYVGQGKYRTICVKEHDASEFVKDCEDYQSVPFNEFQLMDLKSEKRRLEEREQTN